MFAALTADLLIKRVVLGTTCSPQDPCQVCYSPANKNTRFFFNLSASL